jgi:hypothetical protein
MHGGADIVDEAGERQLRGSAAAAHAVGRFEQRDTAAGLGDENGGGEPVRARADDDRIEFNVSAAIGRGHRDR